MKTIKIEPLTRAAFAPFGDVIETNGAHHYPINAGMCERYHDLAQVETAGPNARQLISIGVGKPYYLPLRLKMVERHPLGSQAFIPLSPEPFLVIVAADENGIPGIPRAFITNGGQGVNYPINTWHGVLTPVGQEQRFLIVDRGGDGDNLEEFFFEEAFFVSG
jgi:ureidoglycolate lyase